MSDWILDYEYRKRIGFFISKWIRILSCHFLRLFVFCKIKKLFVFCKIKKLLFQERVLEIKGENGFNECVLCKSEREKKKSNDEALVRAREIQGILNGARFLLCSAHFQHIQQECF